MPPPSATTWRRGLGRGMYAELPQPASAGAKARAKRQVRLFMPAILAERRATSLTIRRRSATLTARDETGAEPPRLRGLRRVLRHLARRDAGALPPPRSPRRRARALPRRGRDRPGLRRL